MNKLRKMKGKLVAAAQILTITLTLLTACTLGTPSSPEATSPEATSDGKITICHAAGSQTNPYTEITVSVNGLDGHDKHEGDIIPAPEGGCPTTRP